jgi:hypothetical protein
MSNTTNDHIHHLKKFLQQLLRRPEAELEMIKEYRIIYLSRIGF